MFPDRKPPSQHPLQEKLAKERETKTQLLIDIIKKSPFNEFFNCTLQELTGERLKPTVLIASFPQSQDEITTSTFVFSEKHKPLNAYWQQIINAELPKKVKTFEQNYYPKRTNEFWSSILQDLHSQSAIEGLPVVIVLFGQTQESNQETMQLYHRYEIPPSIALSYIRVIAQKRLAKLS
jgi:hypothetical protein